jgi:hypothetical protein
MADIYVYAGRDDPPMPVIPPFGCGVTIAVGPVALRASSTRGTLMTARDARRRLLTRWDYARKSMRIADAFTYQ